METRSVVARCWGGRGRVNYKEAEDALGDKGNAFYLGCNSGHMITEI